MKDLKILFKISFLCGLLILFVSFFLDWYVIQIYNSSNELVAEWNYNPFLEWNAEITNEKFENPKKLLLPFVINVLFIGCIAVSGYIVLFNDLEKIEKNPNKKINFEKYKAYSYVLIFFMLLNLYYIFVFPTFYLLQNKLYFPALKQKDQELNVVYYYYVGAGYILQLVGFLCVFPYALFYYQTLEKFQKKDHSASIIVNNYVQKVQEVVDFDKLITQENLKLKYKTMELEPVKFNLNKKTTKKKR